MCSFAMGLSTTAAPQHPLPPHTWTSPNASGMQPTLFGRMWLHDFHSSGRKGKELTEMEHWFSRCFLQRCSLWKHSHHAVECTGHMQATGHTQVGPVYPSGWVQPSSHPRADAGYESEETFSYSSHPPYLVFQTSSRDPRYHGVGTTQPLCLVQTPDTKPNGPNNGCFMSLVLKRLILLPYFQ